MAGRYWLSGALVVAMALAGCGASSSNSASTSSTTSALSPAAAVAGVRGHVLRAGELTGFTPRGHRVLGVNAQSWVGGLGIPPEDQPGELERLQKEGFVAGILEQLEPTNGGSAKGLSIVEEFQTPEAASFELENQLKQLAKLGASAFAVSSIPQAHGYSQHSRVNVEFASGPYYYDIGARWMPGTTNPPSPASVTAAAESLYKRVH